jgi:hypothetical protein
MHVCIYVTVHGAAAYGDESEKYGVRVCGCVCMYVCMYECIYVQIERLCMTMREIFRSYVCMMYTCMNGEDEHTKGGE